MTPLLSHNYVWEKNDRFYISRKGIEYVQLELKIFKGSKNGAWKQIPEEFVQQQLPVNKPTVPFLTQLDATYFVITK